MALYAYNKTGIARTIPVVDVSVPPSPAPPSRGPAFNVTSELRGLSAGSYAAIQVKVQDGTFDFEWLGTVDYATPGLAVSRPSSAPGVAVTDVALRDADGSPFGSFESPIRIDPIGTTPQPVVARGDGDSYLACTGPIALLRPADSGVPILALLHPETSNRQAQLKRIDIYIGSNGPNHDIGSYRLDLSLLEAGPTGSSLDAVDLGENATTAECRAVVPAETPATGSLIASIPLAASFSGLISFDLGPFIKPLTFPAQRFGGVALVAVTRRELVDEILVSATPVWVEN